MIVGVPQHFEGELSLMKKIIPLTLGLSLIAGAAAMAFAQTTTDKQKSAKKKKKSKKGTDTTEKKNQ
jgi:hypothetical protein